MIEFELLSFDVGNIAQKIMGEYHMVSVFFGNIAVYAH